MKFFSGYFRNCLNCDSLRWSHTHFICIPAVHIISFSTIGAKNPKTRFYGGSESSDFRVAYGVAQTNIGYNYTGKTLEVLNIEPGFYHNKHVKAMDKKVDYDNKRKMTKEFKRRRNQLSKQKTS